MDGELVSGSLSVSNDGSERDGSLPFVTYTEVFYEHFPYYLSIGMTPKQYWEEDSTLVKSYRKAEELRVERVNYEKWLQGMYIYEAICDASPLLHAFAKKGVKAHPYTDRPYPINERQREKNVEEKEKAVANKGKKMLEAFMKANNSKFKEKSE